MVGKIFKKVLIEKIKKVLYPVVAVVLLYSIVSIFTGCEQDFVLPEDMIRFPVEVEAEFNASGCNAFSCHNTNDRAGGLDLENWENAMNGGISGSAFIPYNGYWSFFTAMINGDPNLAPVRTFGNAQLDIIHKQVESKVLFFMNWMNEGAKSANGDVALTNISKKLFIANLRSDILAVIDAESQLVSRLVTLDSSSALKAPYYIAASPDRSHLFVSLVLGGEVLKISTNYPYQTVGSVAAGNNPAHIVISYDGNTGYVSNIDSSRIQRDIRKFDPNTMTVTGTLSDQRMTGSHGMVLSQSGEYLYVASFFGEWLFKINTTTFEIENSVPMSPQVPQNGEGTGMIKPYDVKISPDGNFLFISCSGWIGSGKNDLVKVFATSDLNFVNDITVGITPLLMEFTPNGQQLWVCNRNTYSISVVDVLSQSNILTIDSAGVDPHGVVFTSNGELVFLSNESLSSAGGHHGSVGNSLIGANTIIKTSTYSLEPRIIETASFPAGIFLID